MIIDVFYLFAGAILGVYAWVFNAIGYSLPSQITNSINYFSGYLLYLKGIFPIETAIECFIAYTTFFAIFYGVKLFLSFIAMLPFIGKFFKMPKVNPNGGSH